MVRRISKSEIGGALEQWHVGSLIKFVTQRVYAEQLIQESPTCRRLMNLDQKRREMEGLMPTRVFLQVLCLLVQVVQFTA